MPSPKVSPAHATCQRGSSYRGMQWQSEEAAGQHTPPPVLLFQPSEDELQKQSAPDDTGSGYQEESTLALDDTGNHHSKNDQSPSTDWRGAVTRSGYRYLLTLVCPPTKFPEATPMKEQSSVEVVNALLSIFSRVSFPQEIQCDQGSLFTSVPTTGFLEKCGMKIIRSSVYHPPFR